MCLDKIGHGMGIGQALAMATLLRQGMSSRSWNDPLDDDDGFDGVTVGVNVDVVPDIT